jgi:hypothetical protein
MSAGQMPIAGQSRMDPRAAPLPIAAMARKSDKTPSPALRILRGSLFVAFSTVAATLMRKHPGYTRPITPEK